MYETFYGLKEKPFSMIPDPEYLFLSAKHQRALTLLEYGMMNHASFSVICGDTGAGKTTLIRRLLSELGSDATVGLITNTHQSFGELLNWVLMAFGIDPENKSKAQMHQMFISFLIEQYAQNKRTILIVDEAQNMNADTLEELRMLSNINADKDQVIQVVLAGQPGLRETLRKPELMQFAQRISVDYYLEALNKEETATYIHHRLKIAGAEYEIFTERACSEIYKFSGGTPRLINLLCDTSLVYGFAEQSKMIDADIVSDVVREQHSSSVVNNFIKDEVKVAENNISGSSVGSVKDSLVDTNVSARNDDIDINSSKADKEDDQFSSEIDENIKETEVALHEGAETQASEETIVIEEEISERIDDHIQEAVSISESKIIEKNANDIAGKEENPDDDNISEVGEVDASIKEESIGEYVRDDAGDYGDRRRSDIYPLIQVEEKSKINISGIAIGFSLGMLIASILLVAFAFSYIGRSDREVVGTVIEKTVNKVEDKDSKSDEYSKIKAIEAERDRAMEITRSLERERDAAIATAKAQEEMRAAEKRVAELLAEQERKAAIEVRQAKERAMKAEIRAARAAEREKLALEKAKLERIKAEKIRLEKDVMNAEEIQTQTTVEKIADQIIEDKQAYNKENTVSIQNSVHSEANKKQIDGKANNKDEESGKSFVRNPCDSPSAKFLSTCKK